MTREELKEHCERQIEGCEMWAKAKGEKPSGKVYEEHKLILELLEQESSYNSVNSLVESKLKNPKVKTFDILHFVADNAGLSTFEAIEKAYNMEVFEQEPILDKIRVEIRSMDYLTIEDGSDGYDYYINRDDVLQILDKYKAESEKEMGISKEDMDILDWLYKMDSETLGEDVCENGHHFHKGKYDFCPICGCKFKAEVEPQESVGGTNGSIS